MRSWLIFRWRLLRLVIARHSRTLHTLGVAQNIITRSPLRCLSQAWANGVSWCALLLLKLFISVKQQTMLDWKTRVCLCMPHVKIFHPTSDLFAFRFEVVHLNWKISMLNCSQNIWLIQYDISLLYDPLKLSVLKMHLASTVLHVSG